MAVDQRILERLDELIAMGERVKSTCQRSSSSLLYYTLDYELAYQWVTSCLSLLRRVFGTDSDHYIQFEKQLPDLGPQIINIASGILKAAKDDYKEGFLFDVRVLIQAEVFDDFLDQAEYLLDAGYYQPAAVVAGAVLEDGLRKLCQRNNISIPQNPKLDSMNSELAKAGVYNKLQQKQITAIADIRNNAAHGQWDEFKSEDVRGMLQQIQSFMTLHFS